MFFLLFENKTEDSLLVHKFYCLIQNNSSSSGSNWILMSCQPHRVTSGQSNSGQKQISKLFLNIIYQPSLKSNYKTNHFRNIKHNAQIFKELVPSILPLLKEHYIWGTCWYRRLFRLIYRYQVKEKIYKKMNGSIQYRIKKCYINA